MTPWRQNSFAGGELSPSLYGRQDLRQYGEGLRTLRNFIVTPRGSLQNRPGTVYCGQCKATGDTNPIRLLPFVLDDADTFILEVGHLYINVWQNGAMVAGPYVTPYQGVDLQKLKFCQLGSVLYLTHYNYTPATFTYTSATSWAYATLSFDVNQPGYFPTAGVLTGAPLLLLQNQLASNPTSSPLANATVNATSSIGPTGVVAEDISAQQWQWCVTELQEYPDGTIVESAPVTVSGSMALGYSSSIQAGPWDYQATYSAGEIVTIDNRGLGYYSSNINNNKGNYPGPGPGAAQWTAIPVTPYPFGLATGLSTPKSYYLETTEQIDAPLWNGTVATYARGDFVSLDQSGAWYVAVVDSGDFVPAGASPAVYGPNCTSVNPDYAAYWEGPHGPAIIAWNPSGVGGPVQPASPPAWNAIGWKVYRGQNGTFGYLGTTTVPYFKDYGADPDYSQPPPQGRNPFKVYSSTGSLLRTENPGICGFFQGRFVLADTTYRAWWFWGSQVGNATNFDSHLPGEDADEYEFQLNSLRYEQIRGMLPMAENIFFPSAGGLWVVSGSGQGPLTRSNIQATLQSNIGSAWNDPLALGDIGLYVQRLGLGINEVMFDWRVEKWRVNDVTALSRHLFDNHTVFDWAYQRQPGSVIWASREDDGNLLSLTYQTQNSPQNEQPLPEVKAFAWHDTGPQTATPPTGWPFNGATKQTRDFFESICVVHEDAPAVKATINNTVIELVNGGRETPYFFLPTPTWPAEDAVYCVVRRYIGNNGTGNFVRYIERFATRQLWPGGALPTPGQAYPSSTPFQSQWPETFLDCATLYYYPSSTTGLTLTGLTYLAGETVSVWADGDVLQNPNGWVVTSGGTLDLSSIYPNAGPDAGTLPNLVVVGLPYLSDLGTLDVASGQSEVRSKRKDVPEVVVEVVASRGLWTGPAFPVFGQPVTQGLLEWNQREVTDEYGAVGLKTGRARVTIQSSWGYAGRVVLRQVDPLPLEVTGITRELDFGGEG